MKYLLTLLTFINISSYAGEPLKSGDVITANRLNNQMFSIGDIKQSLLTVIEFETDHGDCWVPSDGRDVTGSDYTQKTGKSILPDFRGKFIRTVGGNSLGLGETQTDAIQTHKHKTASTYSNTGLAPYGRSNINNGSTFGHGDGAGAWGSHLTSEPYNDLTGSHMPVGGPARTAIETRPVNISVNTFIKINYDCN